MELVRQGIRLLDVFVLIYFLVVNCFYLLLLLAATLETFRNTWWVLWEPSERLLSSRIAPAISVLAPAHNEGMLIIETVRGLLTLRYPNLEVVIVNDGSTDDTLDILKREFQLVPVHPIYRKLIDHREIRGLYRSPINEELVVVDKVNGGKADAMNAGLNVATGELVCAIDADTLVEPHALLRLVRPFLLREDVVASGGTIKVANGSTVRAGRVMTPRVPRNFLAGVQVIEYLRAFLYGRMGWNRLGGNLIISGAFGLFSREAMLGAGGYLHDTVGEDIELIAHIRSKAIRAGTPDRVEFVPDPVAWTEVPENLRNLGAQRDRWHRGLADVMWRYRGLAFRKRYGSFGWFVYPYYLTVELFGPVVEAAGLIGLAVGLIIGAVDLQFALLFALVAYVFGSILSFSTLVLEEWSFGTYRRWGDRLRLLAFCALESFGYRQLTVFWRLRGIVKFLGRSDDWGAMSRRGFANEAQAPAAPGASTPGG